MVTELSAPDQTRRRATPRMGAGVVVILVRRAWVPFVVAILGAAVFAAGTVAAAAVLGWVTNEIILEGFGSSDAGAASSTSPWSGAAAILAVAVLRATGVVIRRYYAAMTGERAEKWIRKELLDQYLQQPMSWIRKRSKGRLLGHVDSDTSLMIEVLHPLPFSFGIVVLSALSVARLLTIDGWVALIALLIFPLMMVLSRLYSNAVEGPMSAEQQQVSEVAGIAHESFEGALIVKTLGRRPNEVERFDVASTELEQLRRRVGYIRAYNDAALQALPLLATLLVIIVGAYRVDSGDMTAGDLVEVAALFNALSVPMVVFGYMLESLVPTAVSWNRLQPVIEADIPAPVENRCVVPDGPLGVVVDDLSYAFPDKPDEPVLRELSFAVESGEMVAIVGATGSGKSTLCEAIAGILDEVGDSVHISGISLRSVSPESRTSRIAYVFQEAFLFAGSIRDNVDVRSEHTDQQILAVCRDAALSDWIEGLPNGLDTVIGERGVTVSGGQRQRLALARALLADATLVILDDATSAVDTVVEEQILHNLRRDSATTMLIVAHRLSSIERADRVLHLVNGSISGFGTHAEMLDDPSYRELVMAYEEA